MQWVLGSGENVFRLEDGMNGLETSGWYRSWVFKKIIMYTFYSKILAFHFQ
jgi:hypothetical protein